MNIYDIMFFTAFITAIGTLVYQLYNLYQALTMKEYSLYGCIVSFILNLIAWFVSITIFLKHPTEVIYSINTIFISFLLPLNIVFSIFSGFFVLISGYMGKKSRYKP